MYELNAPGADAWMVERLVRRPFRPAHATDVRCKDARIQGCKESELKTVVETRGSEGDERSRSKVTACHYKYIYLSTRNPPMQACTVVRVVTHDDHRHQDALSGSSCPVMSLSNVTVLSRRLVLTVFG